MALKTRFSPLQHLTLDNLFITFGELPPPRKLLVVGVIFGLTIPLFFLPLSLIAGRVTSLKKEMGSIQKGIVEVRDKIDEYKSVQVQMDRLEKRFGKPPGSLSTFIENVAKEGGITVDQVKEKAPQETDYLEINSLEVKVSNVSLPQLVDFLYHLENDQAVPLRLRRIQIKPKFSNRQILDVSLEVATFVLKKEV